MGGGEPDAGAAVGFRAAAHVLGPGDRLRDRSGRSLGGFLLKASATTEPLSLVADLLYALGWALWTGVIVVIFVQIWPEAKKRQYKQALDAYEAALGDQPRAGSGPAPDPESSESPA
jgi:hypothetical protein